MGWYRGEGGYKVVILRRCAKGFYPLEPHKKLFGKSFLTSKTFIKGGRYMGWYRWEGGYKVVFFCKGTPRGFAPWNLTRNFLEKVS